LEKDFKNHEKQFKTTYLVFFHPPSMWNPGNDKWGRVQWMQNFILWGFKPPELVASVYLCKFKLKMEISSLDFSYLKALTC